MQNVISVCPDNLIKNVHHMIFTNWRVTIGFWMVFASLIFLQMGFDTPYLYFNILSTINCTVVFILASHITAAWLLPKLLLQKKAGYFLITALLVCFLLSMLSLQLDEWLLLVAPHDARLNWLVAHRPYWDRINDIFLVMIMTVGTICCFRFFWERAERERVNEQLKASQMEAELKLLREQINPHFTFNVLNSIEVLIRKDQQKASHMLLGFSEMLRYQLYDTGREVADLDDEIDYLRHYIRIEAMRRGSALRIHCCWPEEPVRWRLAPFLLFPLVENAFKHVSHHHAEKNYVQMELQVNGDGLCFHIENTMERSDAGNKPGIGLLNLEKRLRLIYPQRHTLTVEKSGGSYSAKLELLGDPVLIRSQNN